MKKKSMQKPSKKMDKMYKKMLEKQRLQKKREKYEKLHKKRKQQVPWNVSSIQRGFVLSSETLEIASPTKSLFLGSFQDVSQLGQVLPTPVFRVPTDFSYTKVLNNMYK